MSPSRREIALALLSALLLGAAFLADALGALAWVGFVPLLVALDARVRRGASLRSLFGLGYAFGFVFFLVGTHWIARLSNVAITVPWLKYPAWVAAALYLALYSALATWLAGVLARTARAGVALTFPVAYLAIEELRASGEMGFPWFQIGYTQHAFAPVLQIASLGSVTLVTLWVVVLNVLAWRACFGTARLRAALGAVLTLSLAWAYGTRTLASVPKPTEIQVALVQGNIPGEIKWSGKHQQEILDTFLGLSDRAARATPKPAVVIWPETATGSYLRKQIDQAIDVVHFASRTGIPVFSGFADVDYGPADRQSQFNAAGLFPPDGHLGNAYAKRHLVPFGERMPFQKFIPGLGKLELGQAEWTPGTGTVLFPSAAGPFACLVCFESIFPDLARDDVRAGAKWLVNITNDEWFGNGAAITQHAAMAPFRAVENHVPLARCANTGITMLVDAYGRVTGRLPVYTVDVLVGPLSAVGPTTWYTRLGDWPGALAGAAVAFLLGRAAWLALTARKTAH